MERQINQVGHVCMWLIGYLRLDLRALKQLDERVDRITVADKKATCDLPWDILQCTRGRAAHTRLGVVEKPNQPPDTPSSPNHADGVLIGAYVV